MKPTHYEVLGVNYYATPLEIIKSFRRMALITHPDMNNATNANEAMIRLINAYETLYNENSRKKYDQTLSSDDKNRISNNHLLYHQALQNFTELETKIGSSLLIEYYWHGHKMEKEEKLIDVNRFSHIKIGALRLPFIGSDTIITKISDPNTNDILYTNSHYPIFEKNQDKNKIKALTWGHAEATKQDEENKMADKKWLNQKHEMNEDIVNKKSAIIEEGLAYINPELKEEWLEWANYNTNEAYSAALVITAIKMMQELSQNTNLDTIVTMHNGLSGYLLEGAIQATSYFHEKGKILKQHFFQNDNKTLTR